ncbi:MAG: MFS transporter [Desulfobacterales bacterium]|nr:MFS transporter [Desulfobacterales bacterium]
MLVSHGAYYGFFSIHLATLGYTGTFIGGAWALASAAEIVAMLYSEAIFKRFALERVLTGLLCGRRAALVDAGSVGLGGGDPAVPGAARHDLRHVSHGEHPVHGPPRARRRQEPGPGAEQRPDLRARA